MYVCLLCMYIFRLFYINVKVIIINKEKLPIRLIKLLLFIIIILNNLVKFKTVFYIC